MAQTTARHSVIPYLPPQYDDIIDEMGPGVYDPAFTADITSKMNVPHRISADGYLGNLGLREDELKQQNEIEEMNIPEKIIVLGKDKSLGVKEEPKMHYSFDTNLNYKANVTTPPHTLTVTDNHYPSLDDDTSHVVGGKGDVPTEYRAFRDGLRRSVDHTMTASMDSSMMYIGNGLESETVLVQRHLARLSRHIHRLEEENFKRSQREKYFLYPLVVGLLIWNVSKWLLVNK